MEKKELKGYIESKGKIARKISNNIGIMRKFAQIAQAACPVCLAKIQGDPTNIHVEDFCHECQEKIKPKLEWIENKVQKMMEKMMDK